MKTAQLQWNDDQGWTNTTDEMKEPQLIFAFGGQASPKADAVGKLKEMYPMPALLGAAQQVKFWKTMFMTTPWSQPQSI